MAKKRKTEAGTTPSTTPTTSASITVSKTPTIIPPHSIRVNFNHVYREDLGRFVDSIDYIPAVLRVKRGEEVQWISNLDLKVCFHRGTPLACIDIQTVAETPSAAKMVLDNAAKKGYHYNVHGALVVGEDLLFFGDPGCPELIVE